MRKKAGFADKKQETFLAKKKPKVFKEFAEAENKGLPMNMKKGSKMMKKGCKKK